MADPKQGLQSQLTNIQTRTGRTLAELFAVLQKSGLEKHGALVAFAKQKLALGHGDANSLVHAFRKQGQREPSAGDVLDSVYAGSKAALRPLHERVMKAIGKLGDFEIAPKKAYLSLRRARQFAMVGPGTKGRLTVGLNLKRMRGTPRLTVLPEGGMCQCEVHLTSAAEVDAELLGWLRAAFEAAG